jgi:NurA-like 5'-3' nuclease
MVSSVYRDKLAQISNRTPKEIIDEVRLRGKVLNALLEKNIKDISEVSKFCRNFNKDPYNTVKQLGLDYERLLKG